MPANRISLIPLPTRAFHLLPPLLSPVIKKMRCRFFRSTHGIIYHALEVSMCEVSYAPTCQIDQSKLDAVLNRLPYVNKQSCNTVIMDHITHSVNAMPD